MKTKEFMITLTFIASLVLAATLFAAEEKGRDGKTEKPKNADTQHQTQGQEVSPQSDFISANRLIGMKIESSQGEDVGEVSDVLLHQESGKVAYLIVSDGGIWGIGDTRHIIPFNAVKQEQNRFLLNINKEKLAQAPTWEPGMSEETFGVEVNEFFGVSPYWEKGSQGAKKMKKETETPPALDKGKKAQ